MEPKAVVVVFPQQSVRVEAVSEHVVVPVPMAARVVRDILGEY